MNFDSYLVAVDLAIFTVRDGDFSVLAVRRGIEPFLGRWALPGGFVLPKEDLLDAARRELAEETGIEHGDAHLEQLATYGKPGRDPRGRVISVAHLALTPGLPEPEAGSDATDAAWHAVDDLLAKPRRLAFDHHQILCDAVERARAKLEYSSIGAKFCDPEFTINELRNVYEAVWGCSLDPRNFHRKISGTRGFVEPTGEQTNRQGGRPANLYRVGEAQALHPPLLRPVEEVSAG